jgi:hypothetical protein
LIVKEIPMLHFAGNLNEAFVLTPGIHRVYHGTHADFTQFRARNREIYFTTDSELAASCALPAGWLITADVTFQNPVIGQYGDMPGPHIKRGHDGYFLPHNFGRGPGYDCIAFSPSQVKIVTRTRVTAPVRENTMLTFTDFLTEAYISDRHGTRWTYDTSWMEDSHGTANTDVVANIVKFLKTPGCYAEIPDSRLCQLLIKRGLQPITDARVVTEVSVAMEVEKVDANGAYRIEQGGRPITMMLFGRPNGQWKPK